MSLISSANDKGKVEGLVGYTRRNYLVPIPVFESFEALNDDPAPDRGGRATEKTEETSEGRSAAPEDHKSSVTRLSVAK